MGSVKINRSIAALRLGRLTLSTVILRMINLVGVGVGRPFELSLAATGEVGC